MSGHGDLMPKTIKTIAIPAFGNLTTRYKLARTLPTDIGRELLSRTKYKMVADPNQADAVLTGTLHNFAAYPTISANGRATAVEAIVTLQPHAHRSRHRSGAFHAHRRRIPRTLRNLDRTRRPTSTKAAPPWSA